MPATLPVATEDVIGAVVHMLASVTGKLIGDADAPPVLVADEPYGIVDVIAGGQRLGDAANPDSDVELVVQVTSVGATRRQASWLRDRADRALLARNASGFVNAIDAYDLNGTTKSLATEHALAVVGRGSDSSGGIDREELVFNAHERYTLWISPV